MKPLRILHLLSYHLYTGPAEPVLRLAQAQQKAGHRVALAFDTLREGNLAARAEEFDVPVFEGLVLSVKAGPILLLRDMLALKRVWRQNEFDILHCHRSHDHTLAILSRPRRTDTRLVRTLFTERALGEKRNWQLRKADGLVTVAAAQREALRQRDLMPADRIVSVEGAVDPHVFRPGKGGERIRQEAGVAEEAPLAGIVARMKPGRGHDVLLRAWASVQERLPAARLIIAGRGELTGTLQQQVADAPWAGSVRFIGYRQDLPDVYRALDVKVILAPGNDGTCRAALEAMASATPVLAGRRGALSEIVADGVTGRLVDADDADALAAALVDLLSDRGALGEMGQAARHEATRIYAIDRQAAAIEELYRKILDQGDTASVN